jgi:hypothetical protein
VSVGTTVVVDASVDDPGSVTAQGVQVVGSAQGTLDLEGVVQSVSGQTITVSADDAEISGGSLIVHLPAGFDPTSYSPGDEVQLVVTANPDGSFTAVGSSDDSSAQQADNSDVQQGDDQSATDGSGDGTDITGDNTDSSGDPSADPGSSASGASGSGDTSGAPGSATPDTTGSTTTPSSGHGPPTQPGSPSGLLTAGHVPGLPGK